MTIHNEPEHQFTSNIEEFHNGEYGQIWTDISRDCWQVMMRDRMNSDTTDYLTAGSLPDPEAAPTAQDLINRLIALRSGPRRNEHADQIRVTSDQIVNLGPQAIPHLLRLLDSDAYAIRQAATDLITRIGPSALPQLRAVSESGSVEFRRRINNLIDGIQSHRPNELIAAVNQVPLPLQEQMTRLLASTALDASPPTDETRRITNEMIAMQPNAAPLVLQAILDLARQQGPDALNSPRGQRLMEVIRHLARTGLIQANLAPVLFAASDNTALPEPVRNQLRLALRDMAARTTADLLDSQGRIRMIGTDYAFEYGADGRVVFMQNPHGGTLHVERVTPTAANGNAQFQITVSRPDGRLTVYQAQNYEVRITQRSSRQDGFSAGTAGYVIHTTDGHVITDLSSQTR